MASERELIETLLEALEDVTQAYVSYRRRDGDDPTSDSIDLAQDAIAKGKAYLSTEAA